MIFTLSTVIPILGTLIFIWVVSGLAILKDAYWQGDENLRKLMWKKSVFITIKSMGYGMFAKKLLKKL